MFDHFNASARRAMMQAFREARRCQHDFLGTEHVLFGLLWDRASPAVMLLKALNLSADALLSRVEDEMDDLETGAAFEKFPLSPAVRRVFDYAEKEAGERNEALVGPEHLLIGLLGEDTCEAAHLLHQAGARLPAVRQALSLLVPSEMPERLVQADEKTLPGVPEEASPASLQKLVAPPPRHKDREETVISLAQELPAQTPGDLIQYGQSVQGQLRATQLVLGGVLGFLGGFILGRNDGWGFGLLFALGGLALAALRNSLLGTIAGFCAGLMLPRLSFHDDTWPGARLILGVLGAFAGSFLGDFWRKKPARSVVPHEPDDLSDGGSLD